MTCPYPIATPRAMSAFPSFCHICPGLAIAALATLAGCSIDSMTRGFAGSLAPYKVEVVQGNFVSREQVEAPGMTRLQVRDILGSSLLASVFHADRWEYVVHACWAGVGAAGAQAHRVLQG